jgi:hypothetical protein
MESINRAANVSESGGIGIGPVVMETAARFRGYTVCRWPALTTSGASLGMIKTHGL